MLPKVKDNVLKGSFDMPEFDLLKKLPKSFYRASAVNVAQALLSKYLVVERDGVRLCGRIVETEAYMGKIDKAAHSSGGRRTARTEVMYGEGGGIYVYIIYGMYDCLNVVCNAADVPEAVLIRGIEPVFSIQQLCMNRFGKPCNEIKDLRTLSNGPGKLCKAFGITRKDSGKSFLADEIYLAGGKNPPPFKMVSTTRIGVDYAEEDALLPYRYYIEGNGFVSKK